MAKALLVIFSLILAIGITVYTINNRASDRVIYTLITAVIFGAMGFITKESISNKAEELSIEIPVSVFYAHPNYKPLTISMPFSFDASLLTQNITDDELENASETSMVNIGFGGEKYFDVMQYLIIKKYFENFQRSWQIKTSHQKTPGAQHSGIQYIGDSDNGVEKQFKEIMALFQKNYFVKLNLHNEVDFFHDKAVFPPGMKITLPQEDEHVSRILLENKFVSLEIELRRTGSSVGIGEYSKLLNMKIDDSANLGNSSYLVLIKYKQNAFYNGYPLMEAHKDWAESIINILDSNFNFEKIRDEHIEQYKTYGKINTYP